MWLLIASPSDNSLDWKICHIIFKYKCFNFVGKDFARIILKDSIILIDGMKFKYKKYLLLIVLHYIKFKRLTCIIIFSSPVEQKKKKILFLAKINNWNKRSKITQKA